MRAVEIPGCQELPGSPPALGAGRGRGSSRHADLPRSLPRPLSLRGLLLPPEEAHRLFFPCFLNLSHPTELLLITSSKSPTLAAGFPASHLLLRGGGLWPHTQRGDDNPCVICGAQQREGRPGGAQGPQDHRGAPAQLEGTALGQTCSRPLHQTRAKLQDLSRQPEPRRSQLYPQEIGAGTARGQPWGAGLLSALTQLTQLKHNS